MGTLFDEQVARAAGSSTSKALLPVIEKEILHHDILRLMADAGFLKSLIFFGGTSLRLCHGSNRLSEDLDFKEGTSFTKALLDQLREGAEATIKSLSGGSRHRRPNRSGTISQRNLHRQTDCLCLA